MPRESIAMSHGEVIDFLQDKRWMVLGTIDGDGGPWADAVACVLREETLVFRVPASSRSYANMQRDGRVCLATDQYPTYYEIKGVTAHGHARLVGGGGVLAGVPDPVQPGDEGDGALYAISLDDVASFDFAKIKNKV